MTKRQRMFINQQLKERIDERPGKVISKIYFELHVRAPKNFRITLLERQYETK